MLERVPSRTRRYVTPTRRGTTRHRVIRHRRAEPSPWNFRRRVVSLREFRQFIQTTFGFYGIVTFIYVTSYEKLNAENCVTTYLHTIHFA